MKTGIKKWAMGLILVPVLATVASAETVSITLVNGHPPVFRWVKHLSQTFIPAVNKELEGSGITVNWSEQYGGSLAKVGSELEALEEGLAEVAVVPSLFEPAKLPLQNVSYYTPFGTQDPEKTTKIIDALHKTVPEMSAAWEKHNMKYLGGGFGIDDYQLFTTFPVNSIEDLKGRKIGTPGAAINWLKGTGAVGVSGNLTKYYNAIKTGVYDGAIVFVSAALPAKLFEVAPHVTRVSFGSPYAGGMAANKEWYDQQPEALKKALTKGAEAYTAAYSADLKESVIKFTKIMESKGAKFNDFAAEKRVSWAKNMPNFAMDWAKGLDSKGVAGTKVLKAYMEAQRNEGVTPLRDWDK